jgi:NAD(P)-dependent dehydrogenase (short-subunit alcohol dehydrogenase family)
MRTKAAITTRPEPVSGAGRSGVTPTRISWSDRMAEVERWFYAEAKARSWRDDWDEIEAHILKHYLPVPVGHIGNPDDVARVVAFLASPDAAYINGAVVRVDGGSHTWAG